MAASLEAKLPVTVDTQGRVRTSREQRRLILAEFERSGMSAAQFARRTGLKYSTFAVWVQRYRRTNRPARRAPVRLLEAVLTTSASSAALAPCDMRNGFNGLYAAVTERLGEDPKGGALFVFCNRRRTRIKILCWDGTGLWVLTKRLEQGTVSWPKHVEPQSPKLALTPQALALLTDGVDLRGAKRRPWYERED